MLKFPAKAKLLGRLSKAARKAILNARLDARSARFVYSWKRKASLVEVIRMRAATHQLTAPTRRRRTASDAPLRKYTVKMSGWVIDGIKNVVDAGEAPSASAFIEEAVRDKLRERRRAKLYAAYEEAANDPAFCADVEAEMKAFDVTLSDGLK